MLERKRICFVVSQKITARFLTTHIISLSKDYDIYLVANVENDNEIDLGLDFKEIKSIGIVRGISVLKDIYALLKLYNYFRLNKFDVVHSVTPKAGLLSSIAGYLSGIRNRVHIFTGQVWATKSGAFKLLLKYLDKVIVRLTTTILVDGKSQKRFLIQENVVNDEALVLGNGSISGVDLTKFNSPTKNEKEELRDKYKLPHDKLIYLFLGRVNHDKGFNELIEAFRRSEKLQQETIFLVIGYDEGDLIPSSQTKINNLIFLGKTTIPQEFYKLSDVFCLPSHREGFGSSVIEASACGLPVVCSDAYGIRDAYVDNSTGLKHKVENIDELLECLELLLLDANLRNTLGVNGKEYVEENFSSAYVTQQWGEFYNSIL